MGKYLIWCFDDARTKRIEYETSFASVATRIYNDAVKSEKYSSVVLRKEEKTHGHVLKSWSKDNYEDIESKALKDIDAYVAEVCGGWQ